MHELGRSLVLLLLTCSLDLLRIARVESPPQATQGTQVVRKMWEYIKAHNLQNPKDRRKIDLDDALAKLFKPPLTMFNMNKQLSRHCKTDDNRSL